MSESFIYKCVNCGTELEVPLEYCGLQAECTECSKLFVLPSLEEIQATETTPSEEVAPSVEEEVAEAPSEEATPSVEEEAVVEEEMAETGTVKIDRSSIGMIPDLKDQFKLDFGTMDSTPNIDSPARSTEDSSDTDEFEIPPMPQKKWWQFWK